MSNQLTDAENLARIMKSLDEIANLEPDWNSYGALPPSAERIHSARAYVRSLVTSASELPHDVYPLSPEGSIVFEWQISQFPHPGTVTRVEIVGPGRGEKMVSYGDGRKTEFFDVVFEEQPA